VTFEANSKLRRFDETLFCDCSSLKSICVPSSVRILCSGCFSECTSLRCLTFETDSRLKRMEKPFYGDSQRNPSLGKCYVRICECSLQRIRFVLSC
jgi:hypothetical protein